MSHSQFHSIELFILRHAWLNLWDKRMLLAESTRLLSLSCWRYNLTVIILLIQIGLYPSVVLCYNKCRSVTRMQVNDIRSRLYYNFAEWAINKVWLCFLLTGNNASDMGLWSVSIKKSYLMLSCLGFSLTEFRPSWCVRLRRGFWSFSLLQLAVVLNGTKNSSVGRAFVVIQTRKRSHKDLNPLWIGSSTRVLFRMVCWRFTILLSCSSVKFQPPHIAAQ
jgi:hypothetical protein